MSKSPDAFRTISEVADWLDLQPHVLRFWESKFAQIKPVKRAGGRRYYRPADMQLLGGIKQLLHEDGMTIKGAQKIIREQGVAHVCNLSQPLESFPGSAATETPDTAADSATNGAGPGTVLPFKSRPDPEPAAEQTRATLQTGEDFASPELPMDMPLHRQAEKAAAPEAPADDSAVEAVGEDTPAPIETDESAPSDAAEFNAPEFTQTSALSTMFGSEDDAGSETPSADAAAASLGEHELPSPASEELANLQQDASAPESDPSGDSINEPRPDVVDVPEVADESALPVSAGTLSLLSRTHTIPQENRTEVVALTQELRRWLDRAAGTRIS